MKKRLYPSQSISKPSRDEPYEPKQRACLMCRSKFMSEHTGHRICKSCKGTSAYRTELP